MQGEDRVIVHLVPIGGAPNLKQDRLSLPSSMVVAKLQKFLSDHLGDSRLGESRQVHLFLSKGFAPNPENSVADLYDLYRNTTTNELVLEFSFQLIHA